MKRTNFKNIMLILTLTLTFASCKEDNEEDITPNILEIYPALEGTWEQQPPCTDVDEFGPLVVINSDGFGTYNSYDTFSGNSTIYKGKVTIDNGYLSIDGFNITEMIDLKDTIGHYPYPEGCYVYGVDVDSIRYTGLINTQAEGKSEYYRFVE